MAETAAGEVEFQFSKKEIQMFMEEEEENQFFMEEEEEIEATEVFKLDNGDLVSKTPSSKRSLALPHSEMLLKDLPSFINHHEVDDVKKFLREFISAHGIKVRVIQKLKELNGKKMSSLDMKECVLVFGVVTLGLLKSIGMKANRVFKAEENFNDAKASKELVASKDLGKSSSKKSRVVETREAKENALGKASIDFHKAIINLLVLLHKSNYYV